MFGLASEPAIGVSAGRARQLWSVAAGLCSGALTAAGLLILAPHYPITPVSLLVRALLYSAAVFSMAWATTISTSRTFVLSLDTRTSLALHTASTAIWLAPLAAVAYQKSWFAVLLWFVFWAELAQLVAFLRRTPQNNDAPRGQFTEPIFIFPRQNLKPILLSVAGAILCQAAVVTAIGSRVVIAALLTILGTVMLAWRGVRMIEDSPPVMSRSSQRQPLYLLVITMWLIIFSWLPFILSYGQFRSLSLLWRLFTPEPSRSASASANQPSDPNKKEGGGAPLIHDPVFPGVILYPEHETRTILIAPPAQAIMGSGTAQSDPLSIPFDGVYWLWQPPDHQPTAKAVPKFGNPTTVGFHSADGSALWMEAHQNLVHAINLECCSAIQVVIDNAETQPKGMALELMLRNTAVTGKPYVSLGMQNISEQHGVHSNFPVSQTLTFHIPREAKLGKFDEVKVWFRLQWWRGDKSARIAINRLVLVPGR